MQRRYGPRPPAKPAIESFIADGRQDLKDPKQLVYGQSITDASIGWQRTVPVLQELAAAVRARRGTR